MRLQVKPIVCVLLTIVLAFALCCCSRKEQTTERIEGKPLQNGAATYYIIDRNEKDQIIKRAHYDSEDTLLDAAAFDYTYDPNGKTIRCRETDLRTGAYRETEYDAFRRKTCLTLYTSEGVRTKQWEYLPNGSVKKSRQYRNGKETGYTLYDYYSDGQIKNETDYALDGKTVKITTYYKDKLLYQVKLFDPQGSIRQIVKYHYKGTALVKKCVYNADFELTDTYDYTQSPPLHTAYDNGEPAKDATDTAG